MPYVSKNSRTRLDEGAYLKTPGELQYKIALLINEYMGNKCDYQTLNDVMGALAGAQQEFYRRIVAPYENEKLETNGDVYGV
jgi:hypothetical protein